MRKATQQRPVVGKAPRLIPFRLGSRCNFDLKVPEMRNAEECAAVTGGSGSLAQSPVWVYNGRWNLQSVQRKGAFCWRRRGRALLPGLKVALPSIQSLPTARAQIQRLKRPAARSLRCARRTLWGSMFCAVALAGSRRAFPLRKPFAQWRGAPLLKTRALRPLKKTSCPNAKSRFLRFLR